MSFLKDVPVIRRINNFSSVLDLAALIEMIEDARKGLLQRKLVEEFDFDKIQIQKVLKER